MRGVMPSRRVCKQCKQPFEMGRRSDLQYCSTDCRQRAWRARRPKKKGADGAQAAPSSSGSAGAMLVQLAQSIEAAHSAMKQELTAARERIAALENRLGAGNGSALGNALAAPVGVQRDPSPPANKESLEKDAETIAELKERLSTMQQELLQARETIEQVGAQLAQQKAEADELRRAKEEAEAQRNRMQECLARQERDATQEIAILREQLGDARAAEMDVEDQTERLKKKLAEANAELLAEIQAHQLTRGRAEKLPTQLSANPPATEAEATPAHPSAALLTELVVQRLQRMKRS